MNLVKRSRHLINSIRIKIAEKQFDNQLKYILNTNRSSDVLIVVFSGFPGKNGASYNYMRTLKEVKCNKLFILDDFGYEHRGSYYLGESGDYYVKTKVIQLIDKIREELSIKTLITAGSSKGGTCAIMFGLLEKANTIIAGAPQYYIGNYLSDEEKINILKGICGDNPNAVGELNSLLPDIIQNSSRKNVKIYLHYSINEHTYAEHIQYLIRDLEKSGFQVFKDSKDYSKHEEVALYFPSYLKEIVNLFVDFQ